MNKIPDDVSIYLKLAQFVINSKQSFEQIFKLNESIETIIENINNINKELASVDENIEVESAETTHQQHQNDDIPNEIMHYLEIAKMAIESKQSFEEFFKLNESIETIMENINTLMSSKSIEIHNLRASMRPPLDPEMVEEEYILMTRSFMHDAKQYWIDDKSILYNDDNEKIGTIVNNNEVVFI
jgi:hypothetical protein